MKKLLSLPTFFKMIFVLTVFFSGISFNVTAQIQQDSIKTIFDKAVLDIAKVASEAIINSSGTIPSKDKAENKKSIKYKDWESFKNSTAKYETIKNEVVDKKEEWIWTDVNSENIEKIKIYVDKLTTKNKSIKAQEKELDKILKDTEESISKLVTTNVVVVESKIEDKVQDEEFMELKNEIITLKIKNDSVFNVVNQLNKGKQEPLLIPKEYQEYVLLASLGLIVVLLLLILFTNNNLNSLKDKVKRLSPTSNKSDFDSSKFVFSHIFKIEKEQLETKIQELQKIIHSLTNDIEILKIKNDKINIEKSPTEPIYTPPINQNPMPPLNSVETKYAKDPSESNGFLNSYLQSQNDSEAVYVIHIHGQNATFEINEQNSNAMQRAMIDIEGFFSKACDTQGIPDASKRLTQLSKGRLELKDNVWIIKEKIKIKFA